MEQLHFRGKNRREFHAVLREVDAIGAQLALKRRVLLSVDAKNRSKGADASAPFANIASGLEKREYPH